MQQQTMILPTAITTRTVSTMTNEIRAALAMPGDVVIDASAAETVDLSFLQLIEAARRHSEAGAATLRLAAPANPAIAALLHRAGVLTAPTPADIDFWFHGDLPR